jgi:hypothetical protein
MEPEGLTALHLLIKLRMATLSEIPPIRPSGSELGTIPLNASNLTPDSGAVNN